MPVMDQTEAEAHAAADCGTADGIGAAIDQCAANTASYCAENCAEHDDAAHVFI